MPALTPKDLPGLEISVEKTSSGRGGYKVRAILDDEVVGIISISLPLGSGECLGAYGVTFSMVHIKGLGPLMYEVAMELAGKRGLMSDRMDVSQEARRVWENFDARSDTKKKQLDNPYGWLTPNDPQDDCRQDSAGKDWVESPLSRVNYKTTTPVLDELRRLGMLKASSKRADLSPPLGYPGGPCHVIERIHNEVPNPRLRDRLVDEIEDGESLSNPDASKVYHVEQERGIQGKFLAKLVFTAHAQYRMDLRGITVPEVRTALANFRKDYFDEKSRNSPLFKNWEEARAWREGIRYYAPSGLVVVFEALKDEAHIITVYWEHGDDPHYVDETECGFPEAGRRASARNKTSALIGEILSRTGPEVSGKAGEVAYKRTRINPDQGLLLYDVSGSKGETYKVRLKALRKSNIKSFGKLHVRVSCTCPFFRWQGPEHWAKANKFLYGKPEGTASKPDQKDPSGQNWVCKHVYAILDEKKNKRFASQDGLSQKLDYVFEPMPEEYRVAARWARGVR